MEFKRHTRGILAGAALAGALMLLGAPRVTFAQQEGPQKPAPSQEPVPPKPPTGQQQNPKPSQEAPQVAIAIESNLVTIEAVVTDEDGNLLTGLKRENFRIIDGDKAQQITNFSPTEAPITVVILMEYSAQYYGYFGYKSQVWAYNFLNHLNNKDWVAFKIYDIKPELVVDFTHEVAEVRGAVANLGPPGFHEACVYDAVIQTLDELRDVHGKKSILLLSTGFDTFSKHTLDDTYHRLKETDIPIFSVGLGEDLDLRANNGRGLSGNQHVNYLQAKNQLTQFSNMTGGYAWFPRFEGEMGSIFNSVGAFLRSQYSLGFSPGTPNDGKFHKIKVEVVDDQGNPMLVPTGKKGKMKKVTVYARNGYTSPRPLGGN